MKYATAITGLVAAVSAQHWRDRDGYKEVALGESCAIEPASADGKKPAKRPRCGGRRESPPTACCGALLATAGTADTADNRKEQCIAPAATTATVITTPAVEGVAPACMNTAVNPPEPFATGTDCLSGCLTAGSAAVPNCQWRAAVQAHGPVTADWHVVHCIQSAQALVASSAVAVAYLMA